MEHNNKKNITIYTDGACSGNPGAGGWGAVMLYPTASTTITKQICGGNSKTTNNIMELSAVIFALKALKEPCNVTIYTDSKYIQEGITNWIHRWKKNSWRRSDKQPVKNLELWMELDAMCAIHNVSFNWVKGHSGDFYNEMADKLAREGIKK